MGLENAVSVEVAILAAMEFDTANKGNLGSRAGRVDVAWCQGQGWLDDAERVGSPDRRTGSFD